MKKISNTDIMLFYEDIRDSFTILKQCRVNNISQTVRSSHYMTNKEAVACQINIINNFTHYLLCCCNTAIGSPLLCCNTAVRSLHYRCIAVVTQLFVPKH